VPGHRPLPSQQGSPLVIAHRGASAERPENTLSAYALAVEYKADMIEIDLHRCRDGAIAISHDADLERFGSRGEIRDFDLEDLRDLDAGDGQSMPTLEEVLDAFGAKIPFNLEIKYSRTGAYEGIEARSLEAVQARGLEEATLFSSFFDPVLRELRRLSPAARTALLLSPQWPRDPVDRALAVGAEAINPHSSVVDAGLVEAAHAAGLAVYVFTVDAADEMRRMLDFGVDGLFTNRPDRMRALLAGDPLP